MHPFFRIPELVLKTSSHVLEAGKGIDDDEDGDRDIRLANLASFARSCRAVSGPALDILWRDMDSLYPVLSLLPLCDPETVEGEVGVEMVSFSSSAFRC
jgi:hypothetical protein